MPKKDEVVAVAPAAPATPVVKTVRMIFREHNRLADVHPDEVENWRLHGWEMADADGLAKD